MSLNLISESNLQGLLSMMLRVGVISDVYPERHSARVKFPEDGNNTSYELKILCRNSFNNKDYALPDLGEDALCLFLSDGIEDGFILGTFYTGEVKPPSSDPNVRMVKFADEAFVSYNRKTSTLQIEIGSSKITAATSTISAQTSAEISAQAEIVTVNGASKVSITSSLVEINAPQTTISGDVTIGGALSQGGSGGGNAAFAGSVQAQGDVTAGNVSLKNHIHTAPHGDTTPPKA